jgi:hypothetical protein
MEQEITRIKKILTDVSTGEVRIQDCNEEYVGLYSQLTEFFRTTGVKNPNPYSDLWEFYQYWKKHLKTYAERRAYVIKLYKNLKAENTKTKSNSHTYINLGRIRELRSVKNTDFDLTKLIRLCEEINIAFSASAYLSCGMLVRSMIDHVPPIFGLSGFLEVESNYKGSKSFKESMKHLNASSRKIADQYLHGQIRPKEVLPNENQIDFSNDVDVLLAEIYRILK